MKSGLHTTIFKVKISRLTRIKLLGRIVHVVELRGYDSFTVRKTQWNTKCIYISSTHTHIFNSGNMSIKVWSKSVLHSTIVKKLKQIKKQTLLVFSLINTRLKNFPKFLYAKVFFIVDCYWKGISKLPDKWQYVTANNSEYITE